MCYTDETWVIIVLSFCQRGNDTLNKKVKELEGAIKAKDQEMNRMRAAINKADTDKASAEKKATDAHSNEEVRTVKAVRRSKQISFKRHGLLVLLAINTANTNCWALLALQK